MHCIQTSVGFMANMRCKCTGKHHSLRESLLSERAYSIRGRWGTVQPLSRAGPHIASPFKVFLILERSCKCQSNAYLVWCLRQKARTPSDESHIPTQNFMNFNGYPAIFKSKGKKILTNPTPLEWLNFKTLKASFRIIKKTFEDSGTWETWEGS